MRRHCPRRKALTTPTVHSSGGARARPCHRNKQNPVQERSVRRGFGGQWTTSEDCCSRGLLLRLKQPQGTPKARSPSQLPVRLLKVEPNPPSTRTVRDALLCRVLVRLCCKCCVVRPLAQRVAVRQQSVSVGPPMSFLLSSRRTLPLSSRSSSRSSRPPSGKRTLSTTIKDNKRREVQAGAPACVLCSSLQAVVGTPLRCALLSGWSAA